LSVIAPPTLTYRFKLRDICHTRLAAGEASASSRTFIAVAVVVADLAASFA
jgi:hypothetical protein